MRISPRPLALPLVLAWVCGCSEQPARPAAAPVAAAPAPASPTKVSRKREPKPLAVDAPKKSRQNSPISD
ncbi:hypothetical protein [Aquisphaera insulae]|uniref:hypothetical protein n=1 Tax=Aquisphaera insulae TaxID=2712864 RepID=UPI0013EA964C|nr:hypothetical protein [Aquisphaera insulae]